MLASLLILGKRAFGTTGLIVPTIGPEITGADRDLRGLVGQEGPERHDHDQPECLRVRGGLGIPAAITRSSSCRYFTETKRWTVKRARPS
jgi:hypothetical protein